MQFPDLDLPPQPATDKWLRETNSREDVVITVPLSVEEDGTPWVFGAIIFGNDAVTMIHNDFYSWNLFAEYSLEFDMNVYSDDLLQPEVGVIRSDAKNLKKIIKKFVEKILDDTGLGFPRYIDSPVGNNLKELREECDCKSISESRVRLTPGLSTLESDRILMCSDCSEIHGMGYKGKKITESKAFNANWVLENETVDGFYETGSETDYLLYSTGDNIGKLEHVIAYMNAIGGSLSHSFSAYKPTSHQTLVYVKNDELVGYLTWAKEANSTQSLQQLFTRKEYRRQGIASKLITTWEENLCEGDQFYAEEPNEKSRALLDKLGYMDGKPEAVEHFLLMGLSNEFEEGAKRAESVSGQWQ